MRKSRAILTSFHNYTPMFDHRYFTVISDFFLGHFTQYWRNEVDRLYILDSNWDLELPIELKNDPKIQIIQSDPNLRYYDAYKQVLPTISEDYFGLLDNDTIVYKKGIIDPIFSLLESDMIQVASIYDTIGEKCFDELGDQSKFCPYFFFSSKELIMNYLNCDWSPVPWGETLSELTLKMLDDHCQPYELPEDKLSLYFDGTQDAESSNDLGYYHIRAGSTPAYLLTHRNFGSRETYLDYIHKQPQREYLRQFAWYWCMSDAEWLHEDIREVLVDVGVSGWDEYIGHFREFHGL